MDNRRERDRQRTLKSGKIVFNHKTSVVDCTVRNLSDTGACLQVGSAVGIPEIFDLLIPVDQTVEEKNGQRVVIGKIATLELDPMESETLALARRLGSVSLVLRGLRDRETTAEDSTSQSGKLDRADTVNVVRFGRNATAIVR